MELTLIKNERPLTKTADTMSKIYESLTAIDFAAQTSPSFDCDKCSDVGMVFVKKEYRGNMTDFAKPCECRLKNIRKKRFAAIPAEFADANLQTMKPRLDIHPKQAAAIEAVKANPKANFVLCGDFGRGKSFLFWALYREAVGRCGKIYGGTLRALIDEFQKVIRLSKDGERYFPPIEADDFRQTDKQCALFLDDIDKARPTEYVAEQLFDLVDAAKSFNHQIVITTNLRADALRKHFESADSFGRFGGAIVRRLLEKATVIELF